ncbi:D-aminoacyl-tRNA deacylase [Jannaschia sp. CCS1]|uniref:D-aminoacyl-tRNA deacylase n=1 Tax=Jannaschia sp. (strain CCS1) TaxID=290400 RepID=DTD_JANSC|nr:D-aminoacyl-tRNA deacylase [Jannaschia sp. CCS1]Q28NX0.1 RecName: Full=D-aminoacyl-tRNA deacylase; Short=DTD; AltName: Full=Gly-tRNA(Ala) deacylase [Jannaschia sp. CCS1]ABD55592.1 D-tyrosyl-tRNA(Tyr) deacylase [Jannaschia sp. CCS1]
MRALIQRVHNARVEVEGAIVGQTGPGLLILLCAMAGDTEAEAEKLITKITKLRIFKDEAGKMNRSLLDIGGGALVVSQFTLSADTSRGNRPGFSAAAPPQEGEALYLHAVDLLRGHGVATQTGQFGADMDVHLVNDGPVTIWMDTSA